MDCNKIWDKLVENGNGYILTSQAVASGVSRTVLAEYVKKRHLEREQGENPGKLDGLHKKIRVESAVRLYMEVML